MSAELTEPAAEVKGILQGNPGKKTPRRPYSRTGLNALKAKVKIHGLSAIDMRTSTAQALVAWRRELVDDRGGEDVVTAGERQIVEMAVRTRLYVDALDFWLLEQSSLVNKTRRAVLPVLRERQALADSLCRMLGQLGLDRKPRNVTDVPRALAVIAREASGE